MAALFELDGLEGTWLSAVDAPALQAFFKQCGAYFTQTYGRPARPEQAAEMLSQRVGGLPPDHHYRFGLLDATGALVGFADFVRDFPAVGEWTLGLLMLAPHLRSRGLGARIYQLLEAWVERTGGHAIRIGVLASQPDAQRFWQRLGFSEIGRQSARFDDRTALLIVLAKRLQAEGPPQREAPSCLSDT